MDLRDKTVLVTGAASGIGRATALAFARDGARLVLADVNGAGLAGVEREVGVPCETHVVDVSSADAMRDFAETVHARVPAVDVLVNNAGVGMAALFRDTTLDDWDWILGINLRGVIHGCHYFVPKMVERHLGGHVVNVSSVLGYFAADSAAAYATTKFAVLGLSEALRQELLPEGIGVSTICPGIINTGIIESMRIRGGDGTSDDRGKISRFYQRRNYGPERVARAIVDAVKRNRAVVPVSPEAWVLYFLKRAIPASAPKIMKRLSALATARER